MRVVVADSAGELADQAASSASALISAAVEANGKATVVFAAGASQEAMLKLLIRNSNVDWTRVTAYHLDEYLGLEQHHPASFCRFLRERIADRVPMGAFHWIDGMTTDPIAECRRLGQRLREHPLDVALIGIGENGHLAFNDPPADFETDEPFLVVELDEKCRRQQVGEGWFERLDDVPRRAITMSIRQIMAARSIVCSVPDARKADAVAAALLGPLTPAVPASILRQHNGATVYLDSESAALIRTTLKSNS